jgi:hypothetical protein
MIHHAFFPIAATAALLLAPRLLAQETPLPPPGAPNAACDFKGGHTLDALRIFNGTAPIPFVFSCGQNRPVGTCIRNDIKPASTEPLSSKVIGVDHTEGSWSCVFADDVSGWVPSDRLSPLPDTPAISSTEWLGWWRSGKDIPGIHNDRLLISRSPGNARMLHVSGRAYWYGINHNVHFGQVDADALARGPLLHIVESGDDSACILDLIYNPGTRTFKALDNSQCGGMNVRFSGEWTRFTPSAPNHK